MKRTLVLAAALAAALPFSALAHKAWLLPSQTVIAGNTPWITVDGAVSNDLFYFNHVPLRLESVVITAPDGTAVQPQNGATGKFRSVFDVELKQQGTYRIASVNKGLSATYELNGERKRWRGTAAALGELPKDASNLQVSESVGRVETFVTNGAPNATALKPTGTGIELVALAHPNDLFAGEEATFRVLVDGQPKAGLAFEIVRGATRYRNAQDEIKVTSDARGEIKVTWPDAGMYWLETGSEDSKTTVKQAAKRRLSYVATLEVLPQ
ncbi:DUF4198 domain-containing protein [Xanthomonas sp. 60]